MTRSQRTTWWLAMNACGALAYLYFASWTWPPAELRGTIEGFAAGDPFVWGMSALPAFLACLLVDVVVLVWGTLAGSRDGAPRFTRWAWLVPVTWVITFSIDRYHG